MNRANTEREDRIAKIGMAMLSIFLLGVQLSAAQTFLTENGQAEFTSSIPLHEFTGRSQDLVGMINLADSTVDFYLDLATLKTGIGKRDRDMRLTLETDEFPFAEFFGKLTSPFNIDQTTSQAAVVSGKFTVHGVSREVEIQGSLQNESGNLRLLAEWELNLDDYQIKPPRLLIIKVDEVQKIRIEALLERDTD